MPTDNTNTSDKSTAVDRIADAGLDAIDVQNGGKAPVSHDRVAPYDVPQNWGIYATADDPAVLIDVDDYGDDADVDTEALEHLEDWLPQTYAQESPHGGTHYVVTCHPDDDDVAAVLETHFGSQNLTASWGEVRVAAQYIVGAGSVLANCGKDWHDCSDPEVDSRYRVATDAPVAEVGADELIDVLSRDVELEATDDDDPDGTNTGTGSAVSRRSEVDDIRVTDVAGAPHRADETRREHPVHGSSTGTNFLIGDRDETWRCWRHGSTGSALQLLAVDEGICNCGDHTDLTTAQYREAIDAARSRGLLPDESGHDTADPDPKKK